MGCDIHLYVETKQEGIWKSADEWITEDDYVSVPYEKSFYDGRNYDLFAILANVRNGRGFMGIKTGEGFNPISLPKGLPVDVSAEVAKSSEQWNGDGHSHSWFTVAELLAYDWTQITINQGWINGPQYAYWRWNKAEPPESSCGLVRGTNVKQVSEEDMDKLVKDCQNDDYSSLVSTYCLITWQTTYAAAAGCYFWTTTMPKLFRLGNPENVRIVFWFDN